MELLAPLGLLGLISVPALVWLWRLSATKRQLRVPSLIPFEHLLRRQPRSRTRLVVNALFWLQLTALALAALALAQPVIVRPRGTRILAILDTSASMGARGRGGTPFDRAQAALLARLARKAPTSQVLVMTTAPVDAVTPAPTSDGMALSGAIRALQAVHLGGNLSSTARIGRSLLGAEPDEVWVITDEPQPSTLDERVRWVRVGRPQPNVAIVGIDAHGALCAPRQPQVTVTVHNFSDDAAPVTLSAEARGARLALTETTIPPRARRSVLFTLPEEARGWVELSLHAPSDALVADSRAWVRLGDTAALPIVVRSSRPEFLQTMAAWLSACPALTWTVDQPPASGPFLLITDQPEAAPPATTSMIMFSATETLVRSYWLPSTDHPISMYLAPVLVAAAALNVTGASASAGVPVISAVVQGRRVPVVTVDEREGRSVVSLWLDPARSVEASPVLLAFFNSVRWLMGGAAVTTTGQPLALGGWASGPVRVHRPDGASETIEAVRGWVRYDATTRAGLYRLTQGPQETAAAVNLFDPLESNTLDPPSTWRETGALPSTAAAPRRATFPLAGWAMLLLMLLLVIEWWMYSRRGATAR